MTTLEITLLSILLPIGLIILAGGGFVILKFIYFKKYTSFFEEQEKFLNEEPYIETITILNTVDISLQKQKSNLQDIIKSSPNNEIEINVVKLSEIDDSMEKFAFQKNEFEDNIKKLKEIKEELYGNLDNSRVFSCRKLVKDIVRLRKTMDKKKQNIFEKTKQIIDPIKEFEESKYIVGKIANEMKDLLIKWGEDINNDVFQKNIDERIVAIDKHLENAENFANKRQTENAFNSFTLYKKHLYELTCFANYFDKFKEILFDSSDNLYVKTIEHIKAVKENTGHNLSALNIEAFLTNIDEELLAAKMGFYEFDIDTTNLNIFKYLNSLQNLVSIVDQELKSFNFLCMNRIEKLEKFCNNALDKYVQVDQSVNSILNIDKLFYWNWKNDLNDINEMLNEANTTINDLKIDEDENNLFTKRVHKYKKVLQLINTSLIELANLKKSIAIFYTDGVSQGLRFNKLKKIYIEAINDIKEFKVKLEIEDKEHINKLEIEKTKIENIIVDMYNEEFVERLDKEKENTSEISVNFNAKKDKEDELKKAVDIFFGLMLDFVQKTFKKIVIIKIFTLLSQEYSFKRINNSLFNSKIEEAERMVEEGKYLTGLEYITKSIKGATN